MSKNLCSPKPNVITKDAQFFRKGTYLNSLKFTSAIHSTLKTSEQAHAHQPKGNVAPTPSPHSVPVDLLDLLHVKQQRWHNFIHMLGFPNCSPKFIINGFANHALNPSDSSDSNSIKKKES